MSKQEYEYYGLMATTWDLFRGDTSQWEDRFFYLDLIDQYGQPVLDVGCGTGRLVLDYLSNSIDVDGVDNSPEMLAICRDKAEKRGLDLDLYQQAMESLNLPRKYRTILNTELHRKWQAYIDTAFAAGRLRRLNYINFIV